MSKLPQDMKNFRAQPTLKSRLLFWGDFLSPTLILLSVVCAYLFVAYVSWRPASP